MILHGSMRAGTVDCENDKERLLQSHCVVSTADSYDETA